MATMPEEDDLRHEVVPEEGTGLPLLHVYLPEGLAFSDVEVTIGTSSDVAEVFVEHVASERVLALIELPDYGVGQDDDSVKYSKKHRRFTIRLMGKSEAPAAVVPAVPATSSKGTSPVTSSGPSPTSPVAPGVSLPPASTDNIFGLLDNDDVSDDDGDGAGEGAAGGGKKKKKKKKGKKGGAGAGGEAQEEVESAEAPATNGNHGGGGGGAVGAGSSGDEGAPAAAANGGDGATAAAKKKKKKKKKGGAAAAADARATEEEEGQEAGGNEAEVEVEEAALPDRSSPPLPTPPETASSPPAAPASAPGSAPLSKPRAMSVDLVEDFAAEPYGSFEVGRTVDHDPLLGPAVHHSLGKVQVKGEDKWLEAPSNSWHLEGLGGSATPVSAFGVFDGHGGRMAAQHVARQLLPLVARFAERTVAPEPPTTPDQLAAEGYVSAEQAADEEEPALERARVAAAQDALIARLPKALHAGFVQCDEDVIARHKASGTTATLAIQVGWELLVANVGDSLAYLDTGSEIVVISANHRVAENTEEQQRIISAGGRIKPAKYGEDDEEDGNSGSATPHEGQHLRVWPGGINMTRTIGDESAKGLLIAEPAVRQISLPVTGARLIIASDGLWDAVNAKTIIGQLRTCNAREAASKAAVYAMRNKKHEDDVTVVVADFVPQDSDLHVPGLLKRAAGPATAALAALAAAGLREERAAQSWRPLETPSESWRDRHRAHRQRAAAYLDQLVAVKEAEEAEAEQLERQRRMAVAPAAGTAGVGTAVRLPPVSDTYRELAELKVSLEALHSMAEEPASAPVADAVDDDWTPVDAKKKKDSAGGFDLRRELMKAARPGEVRPAEAAGGGAGRDGRPEGGRRERRVREYDRDRPARRDRDAAAGAAAPPADGEKETEEAAGQQQQQSQQQQPRGPPPARGERRDRGDRDRRDRAGRGPRGPYGGGAGAGAPEAVVASNGALAAATAAGAAAPGIVRSGDYLYVPKSMLMGGGQAPAAAAAAAAAPGAEPCASPGEGSGPGGYPRTRRERPPRGAARSRREGPPPPGFPREGADGGEQDGGATGPGGGGDGQVPGPRRQQQRRPRKEVDASAAAAAAAAMGGLGGGQGAASPPAVPAHVPVASSTDPVVVLGSTPGHQQHRQQHHYGGQSGQHQGPPQQHAQQHAHDVPPAHPRPQQHQQQHQHPASHPTATPNHAPTAVHHQHQQPQHQRSYHQHHQHQPQEAHQAQRPPAAAAPAAAPAAVPTYAGPMDFGAGFGPGSSTWPPTTATATVSGGQYGNSPAASNGAASAVPQRPPGLAASGAAQSQRNPQDVAAAAAAAAAAAVARKASAAVNGGRSGGGGGGQGGGRGYGGNYAQGRG